MMSTLITRMIYINNDVKWILKDEIYYREYKRKKEQKEFMESLMGMQEQPLIVPPKNPKVIPRRYIEPEKIR